MAEYQAKSPNSLSFELTDDSQSIGKLAYKNWFAFSAVIEMADHQAYQVEPKGFWGTTIEVKEADKLLLSFSMNWHGDIVVQTYFGNQDDGYLFKHRGLLKESFVLIDQAGAELLEMKPDLKWKKLSYEYRIITSDSLEALPDKALLLLTCLHCANYYMSMIANVTGA